jgi:hypothetical protein
MPTLEIQGRRVQVGEEFRSLTPEQQQQTVNEIAATFLPDDRSIDKRTGAPAGVRASVGSLTKPEDRLRQMQKYYPDAQPYEDENFVFTNPKSKRPTLYNPPGLQMGDVASVIPEIYEAVGGTLGGVGAAAAATPAAVPTGGLSYLGVPVGIGLGAAAGKELGQRTVQYFSGAEDTRTIPEQATDIALTTGLNTVGAKAGEMVAQGAKKAFGAVRNFVRPRPSGRTPMDEFATTGVRPTAGAVTGNRGTQMIERGLSNTPGGGPVMQEVAREQSDQFGRGIDDLTLGLGQTEQGAGATVRQASKDATLRFGRKQERLYDDAFGAIGRDTPTQTPNTSRLLYDLLDQRMRARGSRNEVLSPIITKIQGVVRAGSKGMDFDSIRRLRTDVGRMLKAPLQGRSESAQQDTLNALYGSLSKDIELAADAAGPQAKYLLKLADRYTRYNLTVNAKLWDKIAKLDADEKVWKFAVGEAQKGGTLLRRLRANFTPEEWDTVAATVLDRLGQANPGSARAASFGSELGGEGADFSVAKFVTQWEKLAPEAKVALFGGKRYADLRKSLDSFVEVGKRLKDVDAMGNPSGTARNMLVAGGLTGAGAALYYGDPNSAVGILMGGILAPRITAKMITSPSFVRWLTATGNVARQNPNNLPAMIGRLTAIARAEPALQQELAALQAELGQAISQPQQRH